jgi:uncharacterized protein (DUF2235 family)
MLPSTCRKANCWDHAPMESFMIRNLILCAEGTCNAVGHSSSNVARLLEHIDLQNAGAQLVCYDQGIGTRLSEHKRI